MTPHAIQQDISIHTPLAGSDFTGPPVPHRCRISIHTPLAGSDHRLDEQYAWQVISIHTPLAGSDVAKSFWTRDDE